MRSHRPRVVGGVLAASAAIALLAGFNREFTGGDAADGGLVDPGTCIFWNDRTIPYSVSARGSTHLTGAAQFSAIEAAFAEWAAPACTDLLPTFAGQTSRVDISYDPDAGLTGPSANLNLVVFRPELCSSVSTLPADAGTCDANTVCDDTYNCFEDGDQESIAVTTFFARTDTGAILAAGTELNDARYVFTTVAGPLCDNACSDAGTDPDGGPCGPAAPPATAVNWTCVQYDLQSIMAHEAGHFLGFAHTSVAGAVMNPISPAGDLSKRSLGADDKAAVCTVYPAGAPTPTDCDAGVALPSAGGCATLCGRPSGAGWFWLLGAALAASVRRRRVRVVQS